LADCTGRHRLAGGRASPWLRRLTNRSSRFAPAFGFRRVTDELCRAAGFTPQVSFEGTDVATMSRLVGAGLGVSILPGGAIRGTDSWGNTRAASRCTSTPHHRPGMAPAPRPVPGRQPLPRLRPCPQLTFVERAWRGDLLSRVSRQPVTAKPVGASHAAPVPSQGLRTPNQVA
jgi:hypothetical protein